MISEFARKFLDGAASFARPDGATRGVSRRTFRGGVFRRGAIVGSIAPAERAEVCSAEVCCSAEVRSNSEILNFMKY